MGYDKVPAMIGGMVAGAAPVVDSVMTGPKETEWKTAIAGLIVLAVRELFWWIRNRSR